MATTAIIFSSSSSLRAQVIGGEAAIEGDYPWMTALLSNGQMVCGAALIEPQWVLTANHCVTTFFPGQSNVDEVLINTLRHISPGTASERIEVDTIINHPSFNLNSGGSDLALIRLKQPSTVNPVNRASIGDTNLYRTTGTAAKVLGWGSTDANGTQSSFLKEADVVIMGIDTCLDLYQNGEADIVLNNGDSVICAGYFAGTDSAGAGAGDSGGPLLYSKNGEWTQIGVVSGGVGNVTTASEPGVFVEVGQYEKWIDETILAVENIRNDTNISIYEWRTEEDDWKTYFSFDHLQIEYLGQVSSDYQVLLYNSIGVLKAQQALSANNSQSVTIGSLPQGVYIVQIQNESGATVFSRKLVR